MKFPWLQFYAGDWLKEPTLTVSSLAARGVWIDLLCVMHEAGRVSQLRGTVEQLARLARCSPADFAHALTELQTHKVADVTERNGVVTVACRRLKREEKTRISACLRKQKQRGKLAVTDTSQTDLSLKSEVISQSQSLSPSLSLKVNTAREGQNTPSSRQSDKAFAKLNGGQKALADRYESALGEQWTNDSGKWINRIKGAFGKAERVVSELESALKEGRVNTTAAQFAEQTWKEFR